MGCVSLLAALLFGATPGTPQQRGADIFFNGSSGETPIVATLADGGTPVDASVLPCASCHGEDGRGGRGEGGVRPADISAATLERAAQLPTRQRTAYTPALLKRAITLGYDASGNPLDRIMPRFVLTQRQADALLAYLGTLGRAAAPGVSDDAIRITLLSADGVVAPDAAIYGRRVRLLRERSTDVFMTIDAGDNADASMAIAEREHMPTLALRGNSSAGAYAFALTATTQDQVDALAAYARTAGTPSTVLAQDCRDLPDGDAFPFVLMTSTAAARCDATTLPANRHIIVATAISPAVRQDILARAALDLVVATLARLGRDVTRSAFITALEHVRRAAFPSGTEVSWSANDHVGSHRVWLMSLDAHTQMLTLLRDSGGTPH